MIPLAKPDLNGNEIPYVLDCIQTGWISKGHYITDFEKKFSEYIGKGYSTAVSNGTIALHLALATLGIGKGDEVIVPDLTYIATANAVAYTGAKVVLCDVDRSTWCISPKEIEKKITKRTKAIIPVHLYGKTCDMKEICRIAKKHNLFVIEDCAEALGATINDKKVGNFSDISCFSFFGNKIITTGEGGMCFTKNKKYDTKMKHLRNHSIVTQGQKGYYHDCVGYNYRMTNIQAAIGLAQLERIDSFMKDRERIDKEYRYHQCMDEPEKGWVNWLFSFIIIGGDIKRYTKYLEKRGVESRPFFTQLSKMPPYKTKEKFPISEFLSKQGITLPTWVGLTNEQIEYINEILTDCACRK